MTPNPTKQAVQEGVAVVLIGATFAGLILVFASLIVTVATL